MPRLPNKPNTIPGHINPLRTYKYTNIIDIATIGSYLRKVKNGQTQEIRCGVNYNETMRGFRIDVRIWAAAIGSTRPPVPTPRGVQFQLSEIDTVVDFLQKAKLRVLTEMSKDRVRDISDEEYIDLSHLLEDQEEGGKQ